jgi:stringent starvation protein B
MTSRFPTEHERRKREILNRLLEAGLVAVQLDSRCEGVDVPDEHLNQMALVLNLSRKFNQRVLELGPLGLTASLSFNGTPYTCAIPYAALYSAVSQNEGKHYLFSESIPEEMAAAWQAASEDASAIAVESDPDQAATPSEQLPDPGLDELNPDEDPPVPPGPTLRLVK